MERWVALITFSIVAIAMSHQSADSGASVDKPVEISTDDIGEKVTLIGKLRKPLGTKMKLHGVWHIPQGIVKDSSARFTVTHINNVKLDQPIEFSFGQIRAIIHNPCYNPRNRLSFEDVRKEAAKPDEYANNRYMNALPADDNQDFLDGQEWTMIAYETGFIHMPPDEIEGKEPIFPVVSAPQYYRPFTSQLIALVTAIRFQGFEPPVFDEHFQQRDPKTSINLDSPDN